ncbi:MAG: hypothetical protein ACFFKA_19615 [Candidatus Thorarchaeota archaeon]
MITSFSFYQLSVKNENKEQEVVKNKWKKQKTIKEYLYKVINLVLNTVLFLKVGPDF